MKPDKLIVAFETQLVPGLPQPTFTPPSNYKDAGKIEAWLEKKETEYGDKAKDQPYTGTFKRLMIADPANERIGNWNYRSPKSGKKPICLAARSWLLKGYPDAWEHTTHPTRGLPEVVFIGLRTRLFLKMIGIECTLPAYQPQKDGAPDPQKLNVLPLSLWYGNSEHRDLSLPSEFDLDWPQVLMIRGISHAGWTGPGTNAEVELSIVTELATQMGMLAESYES